jgi:hypothetical protein
MPNRIAELRAKIREVRPVRPDSLFALTDAECDALLRQLVLDAERAGILEASRNRGGPLLENNDGRKSLLLDNPGDPDGK